LDERSLRLEECREAIRAAREARIRRRAREAVAIWRGIALLVVLGIATLSAVAVTLVGLLGEGSEITKAGLLALCAIWGGALARLTAEERSKGGS
jgi:hypothetical protein